MRLRRVALISGWAVVATRVAAVVAALVVGGAAFGYVGYDVPMLAGSVIDSSLTEFGIEDLGLLFSPLIFTGLAVAVMLRIGLWNIGAEGQLYAGAIAAAVTGLALPGGNPAIMLVVLAAAGFAGGALWILIPALARAYLAVDEIITTLLLNFVALLLVNYLCTGPMRDPGQAVTSASGRVPYDIPSMMGDLHWGLAAAVVLAIVLALVFAFTPWGYEVRVAGANRHAAHYAGIPVRRRLMQVMLLSGGIAGVAGMAEITGTVHRLQGGISNNFGYLGVMVAVLAGGLPIGVLPAALLMAVILNAGIVLQSYGVSTYEVLALTGLVLLFIAMGEQLAYYRMPRRAPRLRAGEARR